MNKIIRYPFTLSEITRLRIGDRVSISGLIFTGRDRAHRHMLERTGFPADLRDGAIYHCGPVVLKKEGRWAVTAAGPTTSMRLESMMPELIRTYRIRVIMGKGGMGEGTRQACLKYGCVYVQMPGGAAALLGSRVESVEGVHFLSEFGAAEAVWALVVKDMTGVVSMDSRGMSLHKRMLNCSKKSLKAILQEDFHNK